MRSEPTRILKLRPYQVRALNQIVAKLNTPDAAALLVGPTGCGKTEIMAALVDRLPRPARTIVVQDLIDLVRQNGARIASYLDGRKVVTLAASLPEKFHLPGDATAADVVVGTIHTILPSIEYIGAVDVLMIDEAHHAPARRYLECIDELRKLNPELRILGATATPERPDFVGLRCIFGDEATAVITLKEVIEDGFLVPPRVLALPLSGLAALIAQKIPDDDDQRLSAALNLEVMHQEVIRNWTKYGEQRQSVFFCQDVDHSDGLAAAFRDAGVEAESVSYKTSIRKRTTLIGDFAAGQGVKVLTNPELLCEGFDAPPVSCIGLVRWIVSKSPLIQPVGRGLRIYPGKQDCLVLDFLATVERIGDLTAGIDLRGRKAPPPIHGGEITGEGRGPSTVIGYGEATLQPFVVPDMPTPTFVRLPENIPPPPEKKRKFVDGKEVISRAEAIARGRKKYFTGEPCSNGHVVERWVRGTHCAKCREVLAKRERDPEHRAKYLARLRERYRERMQDPAFAARLRERQRESARAYRQRPEVKARHQERLREDPAYAARRREKAREYAREKRIQDSTYAARQAARAREYGQKPETKALRREKAAQRREQDPAYAAKIAAKRSEAGARPRKTTRWITHEGRTMSLVNWARETGLSRGTIASRLDRGLPIAEALRSVRRLQKEEIKARHREANRKYKARKREKDRSDPDTDKSK